MRLSLFFSHLAAVLTPTRLSKCTGEVKPKQKSENRPGKNARKLGRVQRGRPSVMQSGRSREFANNFMCFRPVMKSLVNSTHHSSPLDKPQVARQIDKLAVEWGKLPATSRTTSARDGSCTRTRLLIFALRRVAFPPLHIRTCAARWSGLSSLGMRITQSESPTMWRR